MTRGIEGLANVMGDERYWAFISYFNTDRDYFECHEVMEELWLEEGRHPLLQGLLQAAVGLHHWGNDNLTGAVKLTEAGLAKLSPFGDVALGLDLARLREEMAITLALLTERPTDAPFRTYELVVTDEPLAASVRTWERGREREYGGV